MFIRLLLLFILVPIIELYVLIEAGRQFGVGPTIGMILLTGVSGAYLAKNQGFNLFQRIQNDLSAGRLPTAELLDGALILVGALLLLTPGFCTDLFGFCLLAPLTRDWLKPWIRAWLERKIRLGEINIRRL
jgi:UPF0716 protein FxsA